MFSNYDLTDITEKAFNLIINKWLSTCLTYEEEDKDILHLLTSLMESGRGDLLIQYLTKMQESNTDEPDLPYASRLFTITTDENIRDFLVQILDPEYYELARGFINIWSQEAVRIGTVNLSIMFPDVEDLDDTVVNALHDASIEIKNARMIEYTTSILSELKTNYLPKPLWVMDVSVLQLHTDMVAALPIVGEKRWISSSIEEDARYITSITEEDKDIDLLYVELVNKFKTMTLKEREDLITWIVSNNEKLMQSTDATVYGVLGPCLPIPGGYPLKSKSRDPCLMYGGCRMFTCYENENIDSLTGEPIIEDIASLRLLDRVDWFTGICNEIGCHALIKKRHYAVRMPLEFGGWAGCYCSFECIRKDIGEDNDIRLRLVSKFEMIHKDVGVYDRL